jgi:putative DNA primase/helicase
MKLNINYADAIGATGFGANLAYPQNDIGVARLFYDLHSNVIRYVTESKTWYAYDGQRWVKDRGIFRAIEMLKDFTQAFSEYAITSGGDAEFKKYAGKLTSRRNREGILSDARSISPVGIADFDRNPFLLNLQNGTFDFRTFALRPHDPADMITKMAAARFNPKAECPRWERFVDEITCGEKDLAVYLQKAFGYACTGLMEYEQFYILHGRTSRNGKTTLTESIGNLLGDYCVTAQPQTFSRRNSDGSAASPDTARLKGARLINIPEPEHDMTLNSALMKQLTGGDTYTGRFLNENLFQFRFEGKPVINTNHLPRVSDDTIFASGRAKIIPFNRHFTEAEQDKTLKQEFRKAKNKSAILNWLIDGYRLTLEADFDPPGIVKTAIAEYRQDVDLIGVFLSECTVGEENARLATSALYSRYALWAKDNGYRPLSNRPFVGDLRRRFEVRHNGHQGNFVEGFALKM